MYEKLRDLAFAKHTYKHTTIGFLDDIKAMPGYYEYSLGFFNRFYRPENAPLLVVGDVQPQKVFALAKQYFGDWKKGYQAPNVEPEPPQTRGQEGARRLAEPDPAVPDGRLPHARVLAPRRVDSAALDLVGQLLFSESAPLYQELVVEQAVGGLRPGGADFHRDPVPLHDATRGSSRRTSCRKVKETIDRYIAELQPKPVDPQAAGAHQVAPALQLRPRPRHARRSGRPGGQGHRASPETLGAINRLYQRYEKVTPADVQRVAREDLPAAERDHRDPIAQGRGAAGRRNPGRANHD